MAISLFSIKCNYCWLDLYISVALIVFNCVGYILDPANIPLKPNKIPFFMVLSHYIYIYILIYLYPRDLHFWWLYIHYSLNTSNIIILQISLLSIIYIHTYMYIYIYICPCKVHCWFNIAIENGHLVRGFTHKNMVDLSIVFCMFTKGYIPIKSH